jgi:peptidylprolyl isomerase
MARRTRDRVFAWVVVIAFTFSTLSVSVALIWQLMAENRDSKQAAQQAEAVKNNPNKLKGKQMQDFTPIADVTELQVIDLQAGDGQEVKAGDTLTVDYTGAVAATGKIFESSLDSGQKAEFPLDGVIVGWQEGLLGMKVGGKRRLIIPAEKAYGAQSPSADIPANAALVFDVTLHKIGQ